MGLLARESARPDDALLRELHRAYADEWFAHYNYYIASQLITGSSAASVATLLRGKSEQAFRRADRLAERIIQLGATPITKLTNLVDAATDKPFKLPEETSDIDALMKAVLDAERTSMRTHEAILDQTAGRDPITAALSLELLTEATQGEQTLERLIGGPAPEMTGQ
jgi:bacterioferritin